MKSLALVVAVSVTLSPPALGGSLRHEIGNALNGGAALLGFECNTNTNLPYTSTVYTQQQIESSGACIGETCGLSGLASTWKASGGEQSTCAAAVVIAAGECGVSSAQASKDDWCANTAALTGAGGIWQITGAGGAASCSGDWVGPCGPFNSAAAAQDVLASAKWQLPLAGSIYTCQAAPTTVPDAWLGGGQPNFIGFDVNGKSLSGEQTPAFCHVGGSNGYSCQANNVGAAVMWGGGQCAVGWKDNAHSNVDAGAGGCANAAAQFETTPQKYSYPNYYYDKFLQAYYGENSLDCTTDDCGTKAIIAAQQICQAAYGA